MSTNAEHSPLTYKDAGVDIQAGNRLIDRIKSVSKSTHREEVMGGLGGFGALFNMPKNYQDPVLVSGTDGVGTKLRLAIETQQHDTVGIDLVAMCVNDLVVIGAEPLFFLDYYATGKLNVDIAADVIQGIGEGCKQAGCALIGGETAEMPGMYQQGDYDLAGFCVGVVERSKIIDGSQVNPGDTIIGLSSVGPHSNGYSLIRKVLERDPSVLTNESEIKQQLLAPTKIYVRSILETKEIVDFHAIAHITGGGITENLPRVLPENCQAHIDIKTWKQPECFNFLAETGNIEPLEMLKTFNCGLGMILVTKAEDAQKTIDKLNSLGEQAQIIGSIEQRNEGEQAVIYQNL